MIYHNIYMIYLEVMTMVIIYNMIYNRIYFKCLNILIIIYYKHILMMIKYLLT